MTTLCWLVFGHILFDFPLQGDYLALQKNPNSAGPWLLHLCYHAFLHAMWVYAITGLWSMATVEFLMHSIMDYSKCKGYAGYLEDQIFHLLCKCVYAYFLTHGAV